jgi:hypothetical protein
MRASKALGSFSPTGSAAPRTLDRQRRRGRLALLAGLGLGLVVWLVFGGPFRQPAEYHAFADQRVLFGIPRALDVLSNLPFLLVGLLGWRALGRAPDHACATEPERHALRLVFAALVAVALGSSYYHLAPDDARLFWDRLPIALVLQALLASTIMERVDLPLGRRLVLPLLGIGVASTVLWRTTGDLRLYLIVQGGVLLAVPLMLLLRPRRYDRGRDVALMAVVYALAKVAEGLDARVWEATGHLVSGHTLKHLIAAGGLGLLVLHVKRRHLCA